MAFCTNCGSEVQGRFCAKCGAPAPAAPGASSSAAPPPPPPPYSGAGPPSTAKTADLDENIACALCYTFLGAILFLVLEPYNSNRVIRFHAFQAIFLAIAWFALHILLSIFLGVVLTVVPILGFMLATVLHGGLMLGGLILVLMLMYKAYNRERWVLPVIGPMAEKQA